jgi:hypothetical protein
MITITFSSGVDEKTRKFIDPRSEFYSILALQRDRLVKMLGDLIEEKKVNFCVEFIRDGEIPDDFLVETRASEIDGKSMFLTCPIIENGKNGAEIFFNLFQVKGFGMAKVVFAVFPQGIPSTKII